MEGSDVTLTATVSSNQANVTGTVVIKDGGTELNPIALESGKAVFKTTLVAGTHILTAVFQANQQFGGSTSDAKSVMVTAKPDQPVSGGTPDLKHDLGFGMALGLRLNMLQPDIVNSAVIDANGIVHVTDRANTAAGFWLESHYFIWPTQNSSMVKRDKGTGQLVSDNRWYGFGPFVAMQAGSSSIIEAVGAGAMVGFRREAGTTPSGFGLGVGYAAIPQAQVLGSGYVDGKPAPVDPSGKPIPIQFQTRDKGSLVFVMSVTFR